MGRTTALAAALTGLVLLAGCSEAEEVQNTVGGALDKASVCGQALGIVDLNPNVDPEKVKAEASDKAQRLQDLASRAAEQDVKQNLTALADGYVELERSRVDRLGEFNQWIQRNLGKLDELRKTCT